MTKHKETNDEYHDIFDRVFKRVITLSSPTIIRFINGLFETSYSIDSTITYNWTENVDDNLDKTIADTIITVNNTDSFHIEAQMYKDDDSILLRMFNYGYGHSKHNREDILDDNGRRCGIRLVFPRQIIIYLDSSGYVPEQYAISLIVNDNKEISFSIPTIRFQNETLKDIVEKNMIILLPFKLLKVREKFKKAYSGYLMNSSDEDSAEKLNDVISELRYVYENDIIKTIIDSYHEGNISYDDSKLLKELTGRLLDDLYSKYSDIKEVDHMLHDESLHLEIDKYIDRIEELEKTVKEQDDENAQLKAEIANLKLQLNQKE